MKMAESTSLSRVDLLGGILQSSPIPIFVIDKNHKVIYWSEALAKYSGMKAEDTVGTTRQWKAFYPNERPCLADLLVDGNIATIPRWYESKYNKSQLIEDAFEVTDFFPQVGLQGTWLFITAGVIRNAKGEIIGAVETLEDITEKKRAEEALKQSESFLCDVIQGSPIPQFVIDQDHTVNHWNAALENYSGIKAKEVLGTNQHWRAFYSEERPCIADLLVDGLIREGMQWYGGKFAESKFIKGAFEAIDFFPKMGENGKWLYFTAAPIRNSEGKIIGAVETLEDITIQKRENEALVQVNKKMNLLSSVTRHDVLNQLNVLASYLELIKMRVSDNTILDYLRDGNVVVNTIERQIAFTKLYQDIGVLSPIWQNLSSIITQIIAPISYRSIIFNENLNDLEIFADPLLEKVFYNLIENSIRHGERTKVVNFNLKQDRSGLILVYEDDGVGIPEEEKERIFERNVGKNSGFGLFLSREILSITGLLIKETGTAGKGARFEIFIPKKKYRIKNEK